MTHVSNVHRTCTAAPIVMPAKRVSFVARMAHLLRTLEQRTALARLDKTRLCDIGVTEEEARTESKRALWDVPSYWRN